jgi:WD40 repeat protein
VIEMKLYKLFTFGLLILSGCNIPITPTSIPIAPTQQAGLQTPIPAKTVKPGIPTTNPTPITMPTSQKISYETIGRSNASRLAEISSSKIENPGRIYWLPKRNLLAVISYRQFFLLDSITLAVQKELPIPEGETLLDFEPNHELLAITTDRNSVTIKNLDGKTVQTIAQEGGFGSASFSPSGDVFWLTSMEKFEAVAYDIQTGKRATTCGGFETAAPVYRAFPSPHGKWLVWIARATIQLNKFPSCQPGAHIGHEDFIISHTFTSNEQTLVTSTGGTLNGSFQPLVFFWDTQTGKQTGVFPLVDSPANGLAFSPNDEILVTAGNGLIVWDPSTKTEIKILSPAGNRFNTVAFSPDGRILAVADENSIHLYAVQP